MVRSLRGLALLAVVLAVYFAQYVFDHRALVDFFPPRLIDWFPFLSRFMRWRSNGLMVTALWISLLAATAFGLLSPMWRGNSETRDGSPLPARPMLFENRQSLLLLAGAGLLTVLAVVVVRFAPALALLAAFSCAGGAALYLWAGYLVVRPSIGGSARLRRDIDFSPLRGWPVLIGILGLATFAYLFRWTDVPARIDRLTAYTGLMAQGDSVISTSILQLSGAAAAAPALVSRIVGDGLVGVRFAGLYSGLLLIVAVWLLGDEIFRRTPAYGRYGLMTEDDGRLPKMLATAVAAFGLPLLFFARAPVILEGVAWGSLGLWALLYGLRTRLLPMVGASALLLGVSCLYGPNGVAMVGIGVSIWVGIFVLRPSWTGPNIIRKESVPFLSNLLYWMGGLCIVLLPLFVGDIGVNPTRMTAYLRSTAMLDGSTTSLFASLGTGVPQVMGLAASDLQSAVLAPSIALGSAGLLRLDASMLAALIAPLYVLGLGALIMNADTLMGWTLTSWLLVGGALSVLFARPMVPHWSSLLVVWPAAAMATAFAIDRLRAAITMSAGTWTIQATLYLAVGLVVGATVFSWMDFHEYAMRDIDAASAIGREVRQAVKADETAIIVTSRPLNAEELNVVAFLGGSTVSAASSMQMSVDDLPTVLSFRTRLIIPPEEQNSLAAVQARYPNGELHIYRDLRGNPAVYAYLAAP